MTKKIKSLLQRPGIRYLFVGGSVYLLEVSIILLAQWLGAGPVLAVAISYIVGTFVSFGLQKLVTFGDKRMHHKIVIPQLIATILLVTFNFSFTVLVTKLLATVCPAIISRTIALLITTVWNFYLYKTRIFNQADEPAIL